MSQVISELGFVEDFWQGEPLPLLEDYNRGPSVLLTPADDVSRLQTHFRTLKLIVIPFASSADGRGFSQAAELRALGFKGHIRAQGHILVDQFRAARRVGFTDIEISDDQSARNPEAQWRLVPMSDGYRPQLYDA